MAPLLLLAVSMTSLTGCKGPDDSQGPRPSLAVAPGSVTLTYICGNSFRVRNTNSTVVTVTWDVYKTAETGTLTLPPKPGSASYSETYFTTVNKGTVRLFESGTLIQTKANGNKPACQLPVDSTRPELPNTGMTFPKDTTLVNSFPGDTVTVFYRNIFGVRFHDSTSGTTIRQMLQQFQGEIIGGLPNTGEYIVRFPDPGSSFAAFDALETAINAVPGIEYATPIVRRSGSSIHVKLMEIRRLADKGHRVTIIGEDQFWRLVKS